MYSEHYEDKYYIFDLDDTNPKILKAIQFAKKAHNDIGQKRKYTNEPYYLHPLEVASIVSSVTRNENTIVAALLHDVVEDTKVTLEDVMNTFGLEIASLVEQLTDVSKPENGNRAKRKAMDLEHTAKSSKEAKTVKLADLISNTRSIVDHDKDFAIVYLKEKEKLLNVLTDGNQELYNKAADVLIQSKLKLMGD